MTTLNNAPDETQNSMSGQVDGGLVIQTGDVGGDVHVGNNIRWAVVTVPLVAGLVAIALVWWPIAPTMTTTAPSFSSSASTQPAAGGTLSIAMSIDTNCAFRFSGPGSPDASEGLAGPATIVLTAQNPREEELLITGIRAVVRHRSGIPADGRLKPSGCRWGPQPVRPMIVDLESAEPRAAADQTPERRGLYSTSAPTEFPFTVSRGNPEIFELRVATQACDCTFNLKVDWVAAGKSNESLIGSYRFVPVVDALISR